MHPTERKPPLRWCAARVCVGVLAVLVKVCVCEEVETLSRLMKSCRSYTSGSGSGVRRFRLPAGDGRVVVVVAVAVGGCVA